MPDQLPPPFSAPYAPDDTAIASRLRQNAGLGADKEARIDRSATRLIEAIRANDDPLGGVEDMLREFALSTKEGLALMVLAEALLRVPDARTADQFIEDKLGQGDFVNHETKSSAFLVNASAWALGMSARVIQPGETPQGTIGRLTKRLGAPAVRAATRQAMRLMGSHFVLGETIEAALARAQSHTARGSRYSFDMLGEGARTADDASRYFESYARAIEAIGKAAGDQALPDRPGISVKLSALHPRFEAVSHARVMGELVPQLIDLARRSGQIVSIAAHEVCENDHFELVYGLDEKLNHTPAMGARGHVIGFYAVAKLKDGGYSFEFMSVHQVEEIMVGTQSKGKYGPWKEHFVEMGRKTVIRRLAKYLPLSIEFQTAVALDNQAEAGKDQKLDTIDGDFMVVQDDDAPQHAGEIDADTGEIRGTLSGDAKVGSPDSAHKHADDDVGRSADDWRPSPEEEAAILARERAEAGTDSQSSSQATPARTAAARRTRPGVNVE